MWEWDGQQWVPATGSSQLHRPPAPPPTSPGPFTPPQPSVVYVVRNRSTLAVFSLVLGILGYVCFPGVAGLGAVICGHLALKEIQRQPAEGKSLAMIGLILGYINVAIVAGFAVLYFISLAAVISHQPTPTPP